jgi:hypothetical protein
MQIHIYPLLGTIFYIYFPKNVVKDLNPTIVKNYGIIHNGILQIFSVYVSCSLLYALYKYGIETEQNYYFQHKHIEDVIYYFYLSKYYEYVDTIILYAKNKEPIFIQKFHHLGAVLVWHIGYVNKCEGMVFVCLWNAVVHSCMYLYYLLTLLKYKMNRYRVYITTLQIMQLVTGSIMLPYYFYDIEKIENKIVIIIFDIYIISLIYLFGEFMYENYVKKERLF